MIISPTDLQYGDMIGEGMLVIIRACMALYACLVYPQYLLVLWVLAVTCFHSNLKPRRTILVTA